MNENILNIKEFKNFEYTPKDISSRREYYDKYRDLSYGRYKFDEHSLRSSYEIYKKHKGISTINSSVTNYDDRMKALNKQILLSPQDSKKLKSALEMAYTPRKDKKYDPFIHMEFKGSDKDYNIQKNTLIKFHEEIERISKILRK